MASDIEKTLNRLHVMKKYGLEGTLVLWPGIAEELVASKAWFVRDGFFADVDGVASIKFRLTVIPDSKDIVPVRNQVLEIDLANSTVT